MITISELRHLPQAGDTALRDLARQIDSGSTVVVSAGGSVHTEVAYIPDRRERSMLCDLVRRVVGE